MPKKGNTSSLDVDKLLEERLKNAKKDGEKVIIKSAIVIPKKDAEVLVDYIATNTNYRTVSDFIESILYKHINTYKRKMKKKLGNDSVDTAQEVEEQKVEEDNHEGAVK